MDDLSNDKESTPANLEKVKKYSSNTALAVELPFTFVGAVLFGGLLGFFLDRWLHTRILFTLILGGLGFAAGLKEVIRRLS